MAASRSIAVLLLSLWVMELAVAWPQMISKSKIVCKEFHVAHGRASIDIRNTDVLAVNLLNEKGEPVACVEPNRKSYTLEINSTTQHRKIRGILLRQVFANGEVPRGVFPHGTMPEYTAKDVCGTGKRSVSHRCPSVSGCSLGQSLHFGYESPLETPGLDIVFRYTVVFSEQEYVGNRTKVIPICPKTAEPPTDCGSAPQAHESNLTQAECLNFTLKDGALKNKKSGDCGRDSYNSNGSHVYTDPKNNINYTCYTNKPIRKTQCNASCVSEGEKWCCRIMIVRLRPRKFICTAAPLLNAVDTKKLPTKIISGRSKLTKQCECFPCSLINCMDFDGCPSKTKTSHSTSHSLLREIS